MAAATLFNSTVMMQQRIISPSQKSPASLPASSQLRTAAFSGARRVAGARQQRLVTMAAKQISVDIEKPIGLAFKESKAAGGGLVVTSVSGNAAGTGIQKGDTVIYASSFFGDELWPTDSKGLTNSALAAAPSPVALVYVKGENTDINVKRLPKKAAPKRFGRKLTAAQKELATHICADCGWIYTLRKPFEEQPPSFRCPQCAATKKRFAKYDAEKDKKVGGTSDSLATGLTVVVGLAGIGILAYLGLNL
mmetsp:Transcript_5476/g.15689  ORF Transcript_5476/g.15689 Transcript_5476/m.15689 type:complete len:250 (-) Transcript_5476:322-1071(-)|eukprot:CAMPEP_0206138842 /NCGR_PEP_ID=MMETSP1473-20131121/3724_1 /ASSEMBLY_ACC=CAM_ASM_001109 /TAXON_ID=1461547 /ORGANISM="Stichococcus sp, Strain RCC1054" /LENGTH=249 /DNA_ID=CAMNT_0053532371 /DNA_START=123 /DNA_END=872 /DNA_ORIENTATION=-